MSAHAQGAGAPPIWYPRLVEAVGARQPGRDARRMPAPSDGAVRHSAVLVLLAQDSFERPDVVVLERAASMRHHPGQAAFPGGAADPDDADAVATALREAHEEIGLEPASVAVMGTLPPLWIPVSRFMVTPVLGWWHSPHRVWPRDAAEVARVERVPVADLADPAARLRVRHTSGWVGPAFRVQSMLIWGFTAGVLDTVLTMAGWALPWAMDADPQDLPGDGAGTVT